MDLIGVLFGAAGLAIGILGLNRDRIASLQSALWGLVRVGTNPEVVVAVVQKGQSVLLVHRKPAKGQTLFWQFPSGHLTEGAEATERGVREVAEETGVTASFVKEIGRRVHPATKRLCVYVLLKYESGQERNGDPNENLYVRWVEKSELRAYLPRSLFRKVRDELQIV